MYHTKISYKIFTHINLFLAAPLITILRASGYSGIVRITCIASGVPKPEVSWLFNGVAIEENDHYNFKYNNQSLLSIKDTTFDDTGKYRCIARNYFGSIFGEIVVKIKGEISLIIRVLSNSPFFFFSFFNHFFCH